MHCRMSGYNFVSSMYPTGEYPAVLRFIPHVCSKLMLHAWRNVVDPVFGPQCIMTTMRRCCCCSCVVVNDDVELLNGKDDVGVAN